MRIMLAMGQALPGPTCGPPTLVGGVSERKGERGKGEGRGERTHALITGPRMK